MTTRLAVDIGGTFVDAIMFDRETGEIALEKAATTAEDPTAGVLRSIEKLGADLERARTFTHGTTLGVNALLEREGATTGIITNEGFRDVFEIGRYNLPEEEMYNITYEKPDLLVPRRRRLGVPGRLDADGEVVEPLDTDAVQAAARRLVEEYGTEAIAVCFLNAYQNATHERAAVEAIRSLDAEVTVSRSTDITREYREYERTSTTVLDAYIKPIFESYIDDLRIALTDMGFDGEFLVTRSGGGALTAGEAKTAPVHTIFSGPAGGLIGTAAVGETTGNRDLIAVDMGGTSLDVCVVQDGSPAVDYETELEHHPLMIPVFDIRTIGAGGGSIAWVDRGLLNVGPESAGSEPGPICYGRGGTEPTVTDAALALGYLATDNFLGGEMDIAESAAIDGIREKLAEPLGTDVLGASTAVFEITLANTVSAIREVTVEKGLDPRDFSAVAYGGAGPMFVPLLAREVGFEAVVIPQAPAVFSAWGMLMTDLIQDFSRTWVTPLADTSPDRIEATFEELREKAGEELGSEEFAPDDRRFERTLGMRYSGQEHTVDVPVEAVEDLDTVRQRFEAQHRRRYGHVMDDPAEIVHLRVRAIGHIDKPDIGYTPSASGRARIGSREAYCFAREARTDFDVYQRTALTPGDELEGPAIVQEDTTTVVLHSDQRASVDELGQIVVSPDG